jgi:hypothetical protein
MKTSRPSTRYAKTEAGDPELHARHLLVQLPPKATEAEVEKARQKAQPLAEEAHRPGVDFAELAKKKSEGPRRHQDRGAPRPRGEAARGDEGAAPRAPAHQPDGEVHRAVRPRAARPGCGGREDLTWLARREAGGGISMGDPSGIGPEIVAAALGQARVRRALVPCVFGDGPSLKRFPLLRRAAAYPAGRREITDTGTVEALCFLLFIR